MAEGTFSDVRLIYLHPEHRITDQLALVLPTRHSIGLGRLDNLPPVCCVAINSEIKALTILVGRMTLIVGWENGPVSFDP